MSDEIFELTPSTLQLIGGPHQQPIGTLTAVRRGTDQPPGGTLEWTCSNPDFLFEPAGATATVGAYRSGSATVVARDPRTGRSAKATVQVAIMDGGMPGGR